jgi:hypothetical protein
VFRRRHGAFVFLEKKRRKSVTQRSRGTEEQRRAEKRHAKARGGQGAKIEKKKRNAEERRGRGAEEVKKRVLRHK